MITKIKDLSPRLAEVGKIKIGGKSIDKKKTAKGKDWQPPVKFDHFVITKLARDNNGNLVVNKSIMDQLGLKPRTIRVLMMYDRIDMNFPTRYALYTGKTCVCEGDGEKATWTDNDGPKQIPCAGRNCEYMKAQKCKPNGRLYAILEQDQSVGGAHVFRTTSWHSVNNITSSLTWIKTVTGGKLAGIVLEMEMITVSTKHGNAETVNIRYPGKEIDLRKATLMETQRRENYKIDMKQFEKLALENGVINDNDLPEDVHEEYFQTDKKITNKSKVIDIDADAFTIPALPSKDKKVEPEKKEEKKDIPNEEVL